MDKYAACMNCQGCCKPVLSAAANHYWVLLALLQLWLLQAFTLGFPNLSVRMVTRLTVPHVAKCCCSSSGVAPQSTLFTKTERASASSLPPASPAGSSSASSAAPPCC
jgi:hypothetical protein